MSIQQLTLNNNTVSIDLKNGGRIQQITINGMQILVEQESNPIAWGCYPMAPWVGRLRHGKFNFNNKNYQFPCNLDQHAIHGTCFAKAWYLCEANLHNNSDNTLNLYTELGETWPFAGTAHQTITLKENSLELSLSVHSEIDTFPANIGWHPWFKRQLNQGKPVQLTFVAQKQYACDAEQIPTGQHINPTPEPWDECFTDCQDPPVLRWENALELSIQSSCDHWIVYTEPKHALCVEPVSAAPNALNDEKFTGNILNNVTPTKPLVATASFHWKTLS